MKFLRLILMLQIAAITGLHSTQSPSFTIGGTTINVADVARNLEEARREGKRELERQTASLNCDIERYEQELTMLARDRQSNSIGQLEYETRVKQIERKMQARQRDMDTMKNHADKIGEIMTNIVAQGADVVMQTFREDATRKTQIAVAAASAAARQEIDNQGALERLRLLTSQDALKRMGITAAGSGVALIAAWYGSKLIYSYVESFIGVPTLSRDTSLKGPFGTFVSWFFPEPATQNLFEGIIFPDTEVEAAAKRIALSTMSAKESGIPQRGVIFFGPPGTGKTLMAKAIAHRCGVPHVIVSGSDFVQFGEGAVQLFHQTLDRLEYEAENYGASVFVIDEADSMLGSRLQGNAADSAGRKLLNAYLQRTGAKSKVKIILITNDPHALDPAVRDRASEEVLVSLHNLEGRVKVLKLYLNNYYAPGNQQGFTLSPEVNDESLRALATNLEGFSGRKLEDVVALVQDQLLENQQKIITPAVIQAAANKKINQLKKTAAYNFGTIDKQQHNQAILG